MKRIMVVLGFVFIFSNVALIKAQESITEEFTLEEITVTAQKREENLQKVPIAMSVITGEDITLTGKSDIESLLDQLPGAMMVKSSDGYRISIRGISDDTSDWHGQSASTPTVALNVDGVYSGRKDAGTTLFDLERVEVLYGPQSTMYTSNSPGGIVNVITANPKLDVYELSGMVEIGNYSLLHTQGVMNTPINDTMAMRVAFTTKSHDGYYSNGSDDEDSKSTRLRLLFQPNDKFSFVGTGELEKSKSLSFGSRDAFIDESDVDDPWDTDRTVGTPTDKEGRKLYGSMNFDLGFGSLTFIPAYYTSDSLGEDFQWTSETDYEVNINNRIAREKSFELRMTSSPGSFLTWIFGMNYYELRSVMDQSQEDSSGVNTLAFKYGIHEEKMRAVYGNITYPVTDEFRVTGGLRYSKDDIYIERVQAMSQWDDDLESYYIFNTSYLDWDHHYEDPDYKIGIEYDLSEESMLYADFSTSYRVQGVEGSGSAGPGSSVKNPPPEQLKAYTVGSKNLFFQNRLQLNASAYYYDYKNYSAGEQIRIYYGDFTEDYAPSNLLTMDDPGGVSWGDGRMIGIDIQSIWTVTKNDNLNFSVSYMKSEWTDMVFDYVYDWRVTDSNDLMSNEEGTVEVEYLEDIVLTGKSMTNSPEWTISASYKHIFNLANGGSLETQIDTVYKSEYELTWRWEDYPYNYQEAYHKTDLSATYIHSDGKWTLSAYARNVENYADKRGYFGDPVNEMRVGSPRTYGAILTVRY